MAFSSDSRGLRPLRRRAPWLIVAVFVALLASACATEATEQPSAAIAGDAELPDWLLRVSPPPGGELGTNRAIQVEHDAVDPGENVRLLIDGTDVTSYADPARGELIYDVDDRYAPVELGPGTHTATVEYVRVPREGELQNVIDTFEWQFDVQ